MKTFILSLLFAASFATAALATEFTVLAYPRNGGQANAEDWVATAQDLTAVNASTGTVALLIQRGNAQIFVPVRIDS